MRRICEVKSKKDMRYPTAGDYYQINPTGGKSYIKFEICEQDSDDKNFLILIHEMIEEHLTRKRNISEKSIMDFDLKFEDERSARQHGELDEPGYDFRAPYRREHIFSENIERLLAQELNIDWEEYNNNLIS